MVTDLRKNRLKPLCVLEVFTNCTQYKNVNIARLVLAMPLEMNKTNEVCNLEI